MPTGRRHYGPPLVVAACRNNVAKLRRIVACMGSAASARVDEVDSLRRTALHVALQNNALGAVAFLLELGANVEAREHTDSTAIFFASSAEAVQLLVARGALLTVQNRDGYVLFTGVPPQLSAS